MKTNKQNIPSLSQVLLMVFLSITCATGTIKLIWLAFDHWGNKTVVQQLEADADNAIREAKFRLDDKARITFPNLTGNALKVAELKVCWLKEHGWAEDLRDVNENGFGRYTNIYMVKSTIELAKQMEDLRKALKTDCSGGKS